MLRSYVFRVALVWAAVLTALACEDKNNWSDRDDVTPTVIACEEAYARLEDWCPGFRIPKRDADNELGALCVDYEYEKQNSISCDGNTDHLSGHLRPSLTNAETGCIRGASCDDLVAQHVCDRARDLEPLGHSSGEIRTRPPVCP